MSTSSPIPTVELNDGTRFPAVGLGTYTLREEDGIAAMVSAIENGYRLLDSAVNYHNEAEVGEAVRRSGVDEAEFVVTTKIPGRDHGYDEAQRSTDESLAAMGLPRIGMSLIHWPNPSVDRYVDTWRGMLKAREDGKVTTIGVSNFTSMMLTRLIDETGVAPAVNQVEMHPYWPQAELRAFHREHGIRTESWSPLAYRRDLIGEPVIVALAEKYGVAPAQVVLRWHAQLESTPLPRSKTPGRQLMNTDIFGFALESDEVDSMSALESSRNLGLDPDTHEEF